MSSYTLQRNINNLSLVKKKLSPVTNPSINFNPIEEIYLVVSATSNKIILSSGNNANNYYNNWYIVISSNVCSGVFAKVTAYNATTKEITIDQTLDILPVLNDIITLHNKIVFHIIYHESSQSYMPIGARMNTSPETIENPLVYTKFKCCSLQILSTKESINTDTGSVLIAGGAAIKKSLNVGEDLSTKRLILNSTLVSASANELNKIYNITDGVVSANKALIVDNNKNLSGLNDLYVNGNLYVNGSTTSINSTEINISDNVLCLNSGPTGSWDSGIIMQRYQQINDNNTGDVITDILEETYTANNITISTITLPNTASSINNFYEEWWIKISSADQGINQIRQVLSYNNTTKVLTLKNAFTILPTGTVIINLYNKCFSSLIWQELNKKFIFGFTNKDISSGNLNLIDYADVALNNLEILSTSNTSLQISGGVNIDKSLIVDQNLTVTGSITGTLATTNQSNITNVGILNGLISSGIISITNITDSSSISTGALVINGGLGIAKSVNIGQTLSTGDITLNGTLITANATEINYNDITTIGTGQASKTLVLDTNRDIVNIRNLTATNLTGTLQTASQPNITSVGTLTGLTSSGIVSITNTTDSSSISTGSVVIDGGLGIAKSVNIGNELTLGTVLNPIYGGTGIGSYTKGDLIVATNSTTLAKKSIVNNNAFLMSDSNDSTGIVWHSDIFSKLMYFSPPIYINNTSYTINYLYTRNINNDQNIIINTQTIIKIDGTRGLNGLVNASNTLTGTINFLPTSTTITGTGTLFLTELEVGDILVCRNTIQNTGSYRKITAITTNTSLTVDAVYLISNLWSLVGGASLSTAQFRFGTASLLNNAAAAAYARLNLYGDYLLNAQTSSWTIEMFVRLNGVAANYTIMQSVAAFGFALTFNNTGDTIGLSLGNNGTSYNIANNVAISTALLANTWYHVAVCFNSGTGQYSRGFNGTFATVAGTGTLPSAALNVLNIAGNGGTVAYNGYIDEFRISNTLRWTANYTVPTAAFTFDANTLSLNNFNNTANITLSDNVTNSYSSYPLGIDNGYIYANTKYYLYGLYNNTTNGYILSTRTSENKLINLPSGYSNSNSKQLPFYIPVQSNLTPYSVLSTLNGTQLMIYPEIIVATNATNTTTTTYNLSNNLPVYAKIVLLNVRHTHIGTVSCGITLNNTNTNFNNTYLITNVASTIYQTIEVPLLSNFSIAAFLTAVASTTSYSISIQGYKI